MEYRVVRSGNELYHWGIKGMRWGQRRYQNKDGSLTPAGQKRYNKELEKLNKEKAKLDEKAKVAKTKAKTQAKLDKLDELKKQNEAQKKALKGKADDDKKSKEETLEEKRERLLKSVDAKEIYSGKDVLTDVEIQARINRIDLEKRLADRIEQQKTGMDYLNEKMDRAATTIGKATNLYKKVDDAYSGVVNSAIGKTIAKKLGLEPPKKEWSWDDFVKNINKKSDEEIAKASKRSAGEKLIKKHAQDLADEREKAKNAENNAKQAAETLKKAQQQVNEYNRATREPSPTSYSKSGDNLTDSRTYTKKNDKNTPLLETYDTVSGTAEGKGTSSSSSSSSSNSSTKKPTIIDDDSLWEVVDDTPTSDLPATTTSAGRSAVTKYLEDKK